MYYIFCNLLLLWFGIDLCERDNIKSNLQSKSTKNRYLSSRLSELLSSCATPWQERQLQYDTLDSPVRGSTVFLHAPRLSACSSSVSLNMHQSTASGIPMSLQSPISVFHPIFSGFRSDIQERLQISDSRRMTSCNSAPQVKDRRRKIGRHIGELVWCKDDQTIMIFCH